MTIEGSVRAPQVSEALVREQARLLVEKGQSRLLVLRAQPRWSGPEVIPFEKAQVYVRPAISQFAALAALESLPEEAFLVLLTDRTEQDLGQAVLTRTARQRIETPEEWAVIPELFGATVIDRDLRVLGSWVPSALLDYRPARGWPRVPSGNLTSDFAIRNLLARVLDLPVPSDLDAISLLEAFEDSAARGKWNETSSPIRVGVAKWADGALGPVASLCLTAASTSKGISILAIGLAMDVLWPSSVQVGAAPVDIAKVQARTRIEPLLGSVPIPAAAARGLAEAARSIVLRMDAVDDPARNGIFQQAEQLLSDLGWGVGANNSSVLRAGLMARLRELADSIAEAIKAPTALDGRKVEGALADLLAHQLTHRDAAEVNRARMAVRLVRWLAQQSETSNQTLSSAMLEQVNDGAWVDRAAAAVWVGSADQQVAAAYGSLVDRVRAIRTERDRLASLLLAETTASDAPLSGVIPVESLLAQVVAPISATVPVLLIVLDGMSMSVATEIAQAAEEIGWAELIPAGDGSRTAALAVLPSMTTYSRTSLFSAELRAGRQSDENSRFAANTRGAIFHKNDLRAAAGAVLPPAVISAVDDSSAKVVGVVLNTIDDALAKHDPGGTHWTLEQIQHLRALLDAAALAGRIVVLTSDHGHVVERGSEARPTPGAEARWRLPETGPIGEGELLIQGRRVLAPGGKAILAWREGLRYAPIAAGYHGGASLAEITIPIIVVTRSGLPTPLGWAAASPQVPDWWNDPITRRVSSLPNLRGGRRTKGNGRADDLVIELAKPMAPTDNQLEWSFDVQEVTKETYPVHARDVVDALQDSEIYGGQRARAGRRALDDATVAALLRELVGRGGRAHRDTLAATAGVPGALVDSTLAALRRLINVDGYPVVFVDPDGMTVVLDARLMREQFELGG